jgi:uncharacterized membrane protein YccC
MPELVDVLLAWLIVNALAVWCCARAGSRTQRLAALTPMELEARRAALARSDLRTPLPRDAHRAPVAHRASRRHGPGARRRGPVRHDLQR